MADPIMPFDMVRMVFGTEPPEFYLEILFRTVVVYIYSLVLIRWVGGRGIAQMSTVEFLLVIALGSAVGDSMFYADVPILHAMAVITIIVVINKALDVALARKPKIERVLSGMTAEVIRDGVLNVPALRSKNIGRSELFEALRDQGIENVGRVRLGYLESSGRFSLFIAKGPVRGLPIVPAWGVEPPVIQGPGTSVAPDQRPACVTCGTVLPEGVQTLPDYCTTCAGVGWTESSLEAAP